MAFILSRSEFVTPYRGLPSDCHTRCMLMLWLRRSDSSSVHQFFWMPGLWRGRILSALLIKEVIFSYSAWMEYRHVSSVQWAISHFEIRETFSASSSWCRVEWYRFFCSALHFSHFSEAGLFGEISLSGCFWRKLENRIFIGRWSDVFSPSSKILWLWD